MFHLSAKIPSGAVLVNRVLVIEDLKRAESSTALVTLVALTSRIWGIGKLFLAA